MEIKEIIVPENWEVFIEDGVATFKEKKLLHPRSWEEFCKNYPIQKDESIIDVNSKIKSFKGEVFRSPDSDRYICTSKEEAEAFLALMQLRQLRKAWVGDWKQPNSHSITYVIKYDLDTNKVRLSSGNFWGSCNLSFPDYKMAEDFFTCFRDLCETAKILL